MAQVLLGGELRRFFFRRGNPRRRRYPGTGKENSSSISPPDIPWRIYRVAMSKYFKVSPLEIEERWSLDDVDHAHDALDYVEHLEWVQMKAITKSK